LEDEFNRKIERLNTSISTASEGTKAQLMEQLKIEIASKANLLSKQTDLEIEVKQLKKTQLKEEELKAKELEEDTKKKRTRKEKIRSNPSNENERTKKEIIRFYVDTRKSCKKD